MAWVFWRGWRGVRPAWSALGLLGVSLALVGYFAWNYWELKANPLPGDPPLNDWSTRLQVFSEYASLVFGPRQEKWVTVLGWAGLGVFAATVTMLLTQAWWSKWRAAAGGALTAVLAVAIMGYALALRRPSGFAARNIPLLSLVGSVAFLWAGRWAWDRPGYRPLSVGPFVVSVLVAVFGGLIAYEGWKEGIKVGREHRDRHKTVANDPHLPIRFLASRYHFFPDPQMTEHYRSLWKWGHPSVAGVPDDPPFTEGPEVPMVPFAGAIPNDPFPTSDGPQPMWRAALTAPTKLAGVRLTFRYGRASLAVPVMVLWTRPDGQVKFAGCSPWVIDNVWTLDFPVDDTATTIWVRTAPDPDPIQPLKLVPLVAP